MLNEDDLKLLANTQNIDFNLLRKNDDIKLLSEQFDRSIYSSNGSDNSDGSDDSDDSDNSNGSDITQNLFNYGDGLKNNIGLSLGGDPDNDVSGDQGDQEYQDDQDLGTIDILEIPDTEYGDVQVNIFSEDEMKINIQDLFIDQKNSLRIFKTFKKLIDQDEKSKHQNMLYRTIAQRYNTNDVSIENEFEMYRDDPINGKREKDKFLNNFTEFSVNDPIDLITPKTKMLIEVVNENIQRQYYVDEAYDFLEIPILSSAFRLNTKLDEAIYCRINPVEETVVEDLHPLLELEDGDDLDTINNKLKRIGRNIHNITEDDVNVINSLKPSKKTLGISKNFADYKDHCDKDRNNYNDHKNPLALYDHIGSSIALFETNTEALLDQISNEIEEIQKKLIIPSSNGVMLNPEQIATTIETSGMNIEEIKYHLKEHLAYHANIKAIECLKDMMTTLKSIENIKKKVNKKRVIQETHKNIYQEYLNSYKVNTGIVYLSELKEIIEADTADYRDDEKLLDEEIYTGNNDTKKIFEETEKIDDPIVDLIYKITGLPIEWEGVVNIFKDLSDEKIDNVKDFYYYLTIWYLQLAEKIVDNNNTLPDYKPFDKFSSMWRLKDTYLLVVVNENENIIKKSGTLLEYIVYCVVQILNDNMINMSEKEIKDINKKLGGASALSTSKMITNITKVLFNHSYLKEWLLNIQNKRGIVEKEKEDLQLKKAIVKLQKDPTYERYIKALLYMPSHKTQKSKIMNKYIQSCCKQILGTDFKAFNDINENDNDLKHIKEYMNKFDTINNIPVWNPCQIEYPSEEVVENYEDFKMEPSKDTKPLIVNDFTLNIQFDFIDDLKDIFGIADDNGDGNDDGNDDGDDDMNDNDNDHHYLGTFNPFEKVGIQKRMNDYINTTIDKFKNEQDMIFFIENGLVKPFIKIALTSCCISRIEVMLHNDLIFINNMLNQLDHICASSKDINNKKLIIMRVLTAYLLKHNVLRETYDLSNDDDNQQIPNNMNKYVKDNMYCPLDYIRDAIKDFKKYHQQLTKEQYKEYVEKRREEYKKNAIDILDQLDPEMKRILIQQKGMGISNYMVDYNYVAMQNRLNENEGELENVYRGEDENE